MGRKLLVSRLGAGTITVAFCAALPGCNLAIRPNDCVGNPSSRGMSTVTCPADDAAASDATSDSERDTADAPTADTAGDRP
jgi:hypothetical protein